MPTTTATQARSRSPASRLVVIHSPKQQYVGTWLSDMDGCSSIIPPPPPPPPPPSPPPPSEYARYSIQPLSLSRMRDFYGTHPPLGRLQSPLEHRPSSSVTLPSFNTIIRGCSSPAPRSHGPHDPILLTRNPPIQSGPLSSGRRLKSWKSENNSMVIDQPSASRTTLAGQQLNEPAPSLPTGYPGMRLLLGDTQRESRVETQIKQPITLEFNGERVIQYQYIQVPHSASVKRYKTKNVPKNAILNLEALAIPSSYPAVQASCCRTCFAREANFVKRYKMPPPTATTIQPDPAIPLQPRTPGTDSDLPPLGSDSHSHSDLYCPLRHPWEEKPFWLRPENKIRQREPIRQVKIRASDLPSLDLPSPDLPSPDLPSLDLPPLYGHSCWQLQPPPSTSTSTRIRRLATAPYLPQSQQTLSHPTSPTLTATPYVDRTTRSFTPLDSSPLGPLMLQPSPYSITIPSAQLLPSSMPHYPPKRFSRTATQVGGPPPSALEDTEVWEKVLKVVAMLVYAILSLCAALLNVNAFSSNPITKVPLMIATTAAFFAGVLHWLITLQLHVFEATHHINHIRRLFVLLVAFLAVSVFATVFVLPAHSWSQEECSPYCWAERALVSTVVIGGFASLVIGGWRMRDGDGRLAANWS